MFEEEEALFRVRQLPGEQLPDIACAMLEAGFDSQQIRELAALSAPTVRDAGELFEAALATLGRPALNEEQIRTALRNRLVRRIAIGAVPPAIGTREITLKWQDLGSPPELSVFIHLDDLWDEYPGKRAQIEHEIVERARELLSGASGPSAS